MRSKPRHPLAAVSAFLVFVSATALATAATAQIPSVGLSSVRSQRFGNENLLGFYTPQEQDQFGSWLATGDFNGDGAGAEPPQQGSPPPPPAQPTVLGC